MKNFCRILLPVWTIGFTVLFWNVSNIAVSLSGVIVAIAGVCALYKGAKYGDVKGEQ